MDDFIIEIAMNAAQKAMGSLILAVGIVPERDRNLTAFMALLLLESRAKSAIDGMIKTGIFPEPIIAKIRTMLQASDATQFAKILSGELSK